MGPGTEILDIWLVHVAAEEKEVFFNERPTFLPERQRLQKRVEFVHNAKNLLQHGNNTHRFSFTLIYMTTKLYYTSNIYYNATILNLLEICNS